MKHWTFLGRVLLTLILILVCIGIVPAKAAVPISAEDLLQSMSPEERVGQLFLVTFNGTDVEQGSEIYDLIARKHVSGVVLMSENNNFTAEETTTRAREMILALQEIEWASSSTGNQGLDLSNDNAYVPLLIGLKQIGDGIPGDQILTGLTPLPSQLAVGATWNLSLASQVGQVAGRELSTLGINLYLGPNLDVLETANNEAASSIGVNTYGGDPFWVGEMGKSFISGMHSGSDGRMLVVAQNFPGTGNSDRSPESEVATVRKSLEQLKQIELAPYFTVTSPEVGDLGRVDAVMVSHIRYQGFQGNIRATTRPISFDSNAFQQIMALPQFATWRENGGLIITDDLGSNAVRRFFDPNDTNFDAKQVARSAFLAGNDILFADDFLATGDSSAYATLVSTIDFFVQKYREDTAFAQRVDASVLRILNAKLSLYDEFSLQEVNLEVHSIESLGQSEEVVFDVAQKAVTLINPDPQDLDAILPTAPFGYEDIVIFTDTRVVRQCDRCQPTTNVSAMGLANALVSIYGPQTSSQIAQQNLSSFTFQQLDDTLDYVESQVTQTLSESLRAADWVIFNTLDLSSDVPESRALLRVLEERPDLLSGKKVVVFALGVPTYLDATNISKVNAYYALYSKTPAFLDVAARVLMKELDPPGALPVSLSAVGYDLITMTSPNPNQVIGLELVYPQETEEEDQGDTSSLTQTPQPTGMPSFNIGDTLTIRTRTILDHNNHIVPDGTMVRFNFRISGEPGVTQQFETTTRAGIAYFNYRIEAAGGLEITAASEPALQSETLQINISPEGLTTVIQISPTPAATATPTQTPIPTPTYAPTPTITPEPEVDHFPTLGAWALGVIVMGMGAGIAFLVGLIWWGSPRWGLRSALCGLIGGLLAYSFLNVGFEGTKFWLAKSGTTFVVETVVAGLFIGWIGALIWWMRTEGRYPTRNNH